jgi:hypothetical protein
MTDATTVVTVRGIMRQPFETGDTLRLELDYNTGTLTAYKYGGHVGALDAEGNQDWDNTASAFTRLGVVFKGRSDPFGGARS